MAFPYEDYDPAALGRVRTRSLRRRKARALLASPYDKYSDLGKSLMREVEEEIEQDRRRAEAEVEAALRAQGLSRQAARDAAEDAYRAEQMSFAREREASDNAREEREFAQRTREAEARFGLQRDAARALDEYRRATLAQRGAPPGAPPGAPGEPPEAGAPPGPDDLPPGAEPGSEDLMPETALPGRPPVFQQKAVIEAADAIARLNQAVRMLQSTPGAYGGGNQAFGYGEALAGKIGLGPLAQSLTQRGMTKEERRVRNQISALTDEAIKAISGASVTQYEELRKSYLPKEYDSAAVVEDKLRTMLTRAIGTYKAYGGPSTVSEPEPPEPAPEPDVDGIVRKYLGGKPPPPGMMRSH